MWMITDDIGTVCRPIGGGVRDRGHIGKAPTFAATVPATARRFFVIGWHDCRPRDRRRSPNVHAAAEEQTPSTGQCASVTPQLVRRVQSIGTKPPTVQLSTRKPASERSGTCRLRQEATVAFNDGRARHRSVRSGCVEECQAPEPRGTKRIQARATLQDCNARRSVLELAAESGRGAGQPVSVRIRFLPPTLRRVSPTVAWTPGKDSGSLVIGHFGNVPIRPTARCTTRRVRFVRNTLKRAGPRRVNPMVSPSTRV